jgi:DNA polymerase III gamma/tau subunit
MLIQEHGETFHSLVLEGLVVVAAAQKEEHQQLREALKVLAEAEKQLRVASDQPTWLTAALLQLLQIAHFYPPL